MIKWLQTRIKGSFWAPQVKLESHDKCNLEERKPDKTAWVSEYRYWSLQKHSLSMQYRNILLLLSQAMHLDWCISLTPYTFKQVTTWYNQLPYPSSWSYYLAPPVSRYHSQTGVCGWPSQWYALGKGDLCCYYYVFQLKIYWAEVQSYFVRLRKYNNFL